MSTTVTDVDELEELLNGLSDEELEAALGGDDELAGLDAELDLPADSKPEPVVLEGEFEAVAEPSPTKRVGKRKLKPLNEQTAPKPIEVEEPVKPTVEPADDELDADDAELLELAAARAAELDNGTVSTISMEELEAELGNGGSDEPPLEPFNVDTDTGKVTLNDADVNDDDLDVDALLAETALSPALTAPIEEDPVPTPAPAASSAPSGAAAKVAAAAAAGTLSSAFSAKGALKTFIDEDKLKYDLEFTDTNINTSITRQASLFSHYSGLAAKAQYQADRCKQQTALVEANLNQEVRDEFVAKGVKPTEKMIDAAVLQHADYQRALERQHEAKAIASIVDAAADSFRHKRDMLQMRGTDLRREREGELRILEAQKSHPGNAALEKMGK